MNTDFILSIETATPICSVALHKGSTLIAHTEYHVGKAHGIIIPKMIRHLLSLHHIQTDSIAAVGISAGPGSYTGLRIGSSVAKGICYAHNIPLIAINPLHTLLEGTKNKCAIPKNAILPST